MDHGTHRKLKMIGLLDDKTLNDVVLDACRSYAESRIQGDGVGAGVEAEEEEEEENGEEGEELGQ